MPFVSFAQNAEDVPLWRLFKHQPDGFYLDVGASGPDQSVTTAFYRRGWSGVNLEPAPSLFRELAAARPRDVNLPLAASDRPGTVTLYTDFGSLGGLSTVSDAVAAQSKPGGFQAVPVPVPADTLAAVCDEHARRPIDFLKIDVEGHERAVIAGADWRRHRPRVLLVEATEPQSPTPTHYEWEPLLLAADYLFALFDGLNRFYVRAEDRDLLPVLGYPACVFDDYVPAVYAGLREERDEFWRLLHAMRLRAEAAEAALKGR